MGFKASCSPKTGFGRAPPSPALTTPPGLVAHLQPAFLPRYFLSAVLVYLMAAEPSLVWKEALPHGYIYTNK